MPNAAFWFKKYEYLLEDIAKVDTNYKDNLRSYIKRKKDDLIMSKHCKYWPANVQTVSTLGPSPRVP